MNLTKESVGRQVSPVSMDMLCEYGMFGKVEEVELNRAKIRWADGREVWHFQSELEGVSS